jgi:hypothetical protein
MSSHSLVPNGPWARIWAPLQAQVCLTPWDVRTPWGVSDAWRNRLVLECQSRFEDRDNTRGSPCMAKVRFGRADGYIYFTKDAGHGLGLDRVTHRCTSSMALKYPESDAVKPATSYALRIIASRASTK